MFGIVTKRAIAGGGRDRLWSSPPQHASATDRGAGTVLAISLVVAASMSVGLIGYFLATVQSARELVAIAEDAALSASQYSLEHDVGEACEHAVRLVESNGGRLVSCSRHVSEYLIDITRDGRNAYAKSGPENVSR